MQRTQIYLTPALNDALDRLRDETGLTRSELIRRALERVCLGRSATSSRDFYASFLDEHGPLPDDAHEALEGLRDRSPGREVEL